MYHMLAKNMRGRIRDWGTTFKFGIVRNPYDLVASWYYHHKTTPRVPQVVKNFYPDTFEEWIDKGFLTHWTKDHRWKTNPLRQKQWLYDGDKLIVDKVIQLENINHLNGFHLQI